MRILVLPVTENPDYFKRNLLKYISRLIIYIMAYEEDLPGPAINPYKLYEQAFPIEIVQAMIDK